MNLSSRVAGRVEWWLNIQGNSDINRAVTPLHTMAMKNTKRLTYMFKLRKFLDIYVLVTISGY